MVLASLVWAFWQCGIFFFLLEFCYARPWHVGQQKGYEFTRDIDQGLMAVDVFVQVGFKLAKVCLFRMCIVCVYVYKCVCVCVRVRV